MPAQPLVPQPNAQLIQPAPNMQPVVKLPNTIDEAISYLRCSKQLYLKLYIVMRFLLFIRGRIKHLMSFHQRKINPVIILGLV